MKAKKFLMIAACSVTVLLTSCGTHEDIEPDAALQPSGALAGELTPSVSPDTETLLSMSEATKIAQTDAGVSDDELESLRARLNESDSKAEYVVTFSTTQKAYEYLVNAADGTILQKSIDTIESDTKLTTIGELTPDAQITAAAEPTPDVTAVSTPVPTTAPAATSTPVPTPTTAPKATQTPVPTQSASTQTKEITQDAAVAIARKDAGVSESDIFNLKVKLDYEDGIRVYEIDFDAGSMEYEYEIAVSDGRIVSKKSEKNDRIPTPTTAPKATQAPRPTQSASTQTTEITQDAAVAIARKDAGVSETDIFNLKVKLDYEDGIRVYEIDFDAGSMEYEYEIAVSDGRIISKKSEKNDRIPTQPASTQTTEITQDAAIAIARKDAGVSESEMFNLKAKLDYDDGIRVYEIDFDAGNKEYEYKIAASDGAILEKDIDTNDDIPVSSGNAKAPSTAEITQDDALAIVLADTGILADEMLDLQVKIDTDDGIRYYEYEFCCGGYEYEYEIATSDGRILKRDCDGCDHTWHHSDHHSSHHSRMY